VCSVGKENCHRNSVRSQHWDDGFPVFVSLRIGAVVARKANSEARMFRREFERQSA
jgi:hypothetical protein